MEAHEHITYHEHSCTVMHEKDVLQTDIKGTTWFANALRCWHNLFLLSYTDRRAKKYYTSSHAMKMERARQFRRYRGSIHPLSKFRNVWECLVITAFLTNKLMTHYTMSLLMGNLPFEACVIGVIFDAIVFIDIIFNTKTGYIDPHSRVVVLDQKKILIHYASTTLFLHVASSIPTQTLLLLRYGKNISCVRCKANAFVATLNIITLFEMFRIYEASVYWTHQRNSFRVMYFFKFFRICILGFYTMLQMIDLINTANLIIIIVTGKVFEESYYGMVLKLRYHYGGAPDYSFTFHELSRICKSLFLYSFKMKIQTPSMDKMSALVSYCVANIFYIWSVLECHDCLNRLKFKDEQVSVNEARTINMLRCRQLPDKFKEKVIQYYDFNMTKLTIVEKQNTLYLNLPISLKKEILTTCYSRYLRKMPFLAKWPMYVIEDIVWMMNVEIYLQNDIVSDAFSQGDGLHVIDVGILAVYTQQKEVGHLIDGDYFGELSLVTDKEVTVSTVQAVTHCKILFLHKAAFRHYMRDHTNLFFELKKQLRNKNKTQQEFEHLKRNEKEKTVVDMANVQPGQH